MVRLPNINTGERTLCQDKSKNPSSFWLSVSKKDYGDVYRRPASYEYIKTYRSEPEIKSWTYDYSPRSKAANWDWHFERPTDKIPRSKNASTQDFWSPDVSPTDLALKREGDFDYVRDYTDPEEYARYVHDSSRSDGRVSNVRQNPDDNSSVVHSIRNTGSPQRDYGSRHQPDVPERRDVNAQDLEDKLDFDRLDLDHDPDRYRNPDYRHDASSGGAADPSNDREAKGEGKYPEGKQATYVYRRYNPERYLSETKASYTYHNTPRNIQRKKLKEAAMGIIPANEFYDPDPFERMLPKCDREDTVKMATFPVMTYGRKKKLTELQRVTDNEVILPDPSPLDIGLQEKSTHRKKYIAGPPDSLKVPGFDGGAPAPERMIKRQANYENHRSKRSEIQIG